MQNHENLIISEPQELAIENEQNYEEAERELANLQDLVELAPQDIEIAYAAEDERQPFYKNRLTRLRGAFHGSKKLIRHIGDVFKITVDGEDTTIRQGIKARASIIAQAPQAFIQSVMDEYPGETKKRIWQEAKDNIRSERIRNGYLRDGTLTQEPSKIDFIKMGSYEILTAAPLRMLGTMALEAATRSKPESKAHAWAATRNQLQEEMLHNPTARKLGGYSKKQATERAKYKATGIAPPRKKSEFLD